jgi:hypothetical protein
MVLFAVFLGREYLPTCGKTADRNERLLIVASVVPRDLVVPLHS